MAAAQVTNFSKSNEDCETGLANNFDGIFSKTQWAESNNRFAFLDPAYSMSVGLKGHKRKISKWFRFSQTSSFLSSPAPRGVMNFGRFGAVLPFIFAMSTMAPAKAESFPYFGINVASKHVNADRKYNDHNFGLSLGYSIDIRQKWRTAAEVGFYKNSYSEKSHYAIATADYRFFEFKNDAALYFGVFGGLSYYGDRAKSISGKGFASLGKYILVGGLEATYATSYGTEFVIGLLPAAPNADGLITFRIKQRF